MASENTTPLSVRDKVAIWLLIWLLNIIQPWQYSHQQDEYLEVLKELVMGDKKSSK